MSDSKLEVKISDVKSESPREEKSEGMRRHKSDILRSQLAVGTVEAKEAKGSAPLKKVAEFKKAQESSQGNEKSSLIEEAKVTTKQLREKIQAHKQGEFKKLSEEIKRIDEADPYYFTGERVSVKRNVEALETKIASIETVESKAVVTSEVKEAPEEAEALKALEETEALESDIRQTILDVRFAQIDKQVLDLQENDYTTLMESSRRLKRELNASLNILLEEQFNEVYDESERKKLQWLNLYALARALRAYHEASAQAEVGSYIELEDEIKEFLKKGRGARFRMDKKAQTFMEYIKEKLQAGIKTLCELFDFENGLFAHASKIKILLGFINIWRIYWIFSRLAIVEGLLDSNIRQAITTFDQWINNNIMPLSNADFEGIIAAIRAPRHIYDALSIGLFIIRLSIDLVNMVKHIYKPNTLEMDNRGIVASILAKKVKNNNNEMTLAIFNQFMVMPEEMRNSPTKDAKWFQSALKYRSPERMDNSQTKAFLKTIEDEYQLRSEPKGCPINLVKEYEKESDNRKRRRALHQAILKHPSIGNDVGWIIANFLCNYDYVTHLSETDGLLLTLGFLVFDFGMHALKLFVLYQDYRDTEAEYAAERRDYEAAKDYYDKENARDDLDAPTKKRYQELADYYQAEIERLNRLSAENKLEWRVNQRTQINLMFAGLILGIGFGVAAITAYPLIFRAVCVFALALYTSIDKFSDYKKKSLHYDDLRSRKAPQNAIDIAKIEYETARNDFALTLLKHTIVPSFFIMAYSVCWPAALLLTVAYTGFEMWHSNSKHQAGEKVKDIKRGTFFSEAGGTGGDSLGTDQSQTPLRSVT